MTADLLQNLNPEYHYAPIVYHDSWISIDPIIGCRLNCQYCYMQMTGWTGTKPQRLFSAPDIVESLLLHKFFTPHQTVLAFGNQTDPFLDENISLTLEFFKTLESHQLKNPVAVVTKKLIPDNFIKEILTLEHIKPIFCLSYSGLPGSVEKGVNPEDNRKNFRALSRHGQRLIHFWRPIVEVNGDSETIEKVLDYVAQYAMASVYVGIKLNPHLIPIYNKNPFLKIPEHVTENYGDYLPSGVEERIKTIAKKKYPEYPLYKHTSCAVSFVLSAPDYNATVYRDEICKKSECPSWKRKICEDAKSRPTREEIKRLLDMIGVNCDFDITHEAVHLSGEIDQEEFCFLLHRLNYPVKAASLRYNRVLRGTIFNKGNS